MDKKIHGEGSIVGVTRRMDPSPRIKASILQSEESVGTLGTTCSSSASPTASGQSSSSVGFVKDLSYQEKASPLPALGNHQRPFGRVSRQCGSGIEIKTGRSILSHVQVVRSLCQKQRLALQSHRFPHLGLGCPGAGLLHLRRDISSYRRWTLYSEWECPIYPAAKHRSPPPSAA
jgi:hypothetical protein